MIFQKEVVITSQVFGSGENGSKMAFFTGPEPSKGCSLYERQCYHDLMKYLLSLCIPTNGIIEWVLPVLNSIYSQKVRTENKELFQVVVADNGNNKRFKEAMLRLTGEHDNLVYKHTDSTGFLNQIDCFSMAEGCLIKFVNHRMVLLEDTIDYLVDFAKSNDKSSVLYFSNGVLKSKKEELQYTTFNDFVKELSYWSSWSAGLAFWDSDFEKINKISRFNTLFPHTDILFLNRQAKKYKIINKKLFRELPTDETKKGRYNLFEAFATVYPDILRKLVDTGDVDKNTYISVLNDEEKFIADLYAQYIIEKSPCSYDLSNSKEFIENNFDYKKITREAERVHKLRSIKKIARKILNR